MYVALDTNNVYRWSGSAYVEISGSPGSTDAVPEGASNLYFTAARVLATVLSGLSTASSAVITAADTVLSALGKLQKQISDNLATLTSHTSNTSNPHSTTAAQVGAVPTSRTVNGQHSAQMLSSPQLPETLELQRRYKPCATSTGSRLTEPQTSRSMPLIQHLALRHRAPLRQRRR